MVAASRLDKALDRAIQVVGALVAITFVAFIAYYVQDNYFRPSASVLERNVTTLEDLVRANPDNPSLRLAMADAYLADRGYNDAIAQYNEVLKSQENPALKSQKDERSAVYGLALAHRALGKSDAALGHFNQVVQLSADIDVPRGDQPLQASHYYLGELYLKNGALEDAAAHLEKAAFLDLGDADALYLLGAVYQKQGRHEEAVEDLSRVVAFVPDFREAYDALAQSYRALGNQTMESYTAGMSAMLVGNHRKAITLLESAVQGAPDLAAAFWGLGRAYEGAGQTDEALAAYQQALKVTPDYAPAQGDLYRLQKASPQGG